MRNKKKIALLSICIIIVVLFARWLFIWPNATIISDLEIRNGDRFFISKVEPKDETEELVLDYFKVFISDDYDKLNKITNFADGQYVSSYKSDYREGNYIVETTVNSINKVTEEEYMDESNSKYYGYKHNLDAYNPTQTQVVEVDYDKKLTKDYARIAQFGDGRYILYYVIAKNEDNPEWRIVDIYGHM